MEVKMSVFPGKPGTAGKIQVKEGQQVAAGDVLVQVETGKGNRSVKAPAAGTITKILFEEGGEIKSAQVLFELTEEAEGSASSEKEAAASERKQVEADLLVIGGGPGGYVAAIYAAQRGLKVALAEKEELGGTCLNVGCIPTKALVKSAEACHSITRAAEFGIGISGEATPDMKKIIERKNQVKGKLVDGIHYLMEKNKIQVLSGAASFLSEDKVLVAGKESYEVEAKDIIVATGSRTSHIPISGIDLPFVMNSTQALSCTELPESITIIGGGVIGMEFAFVYRYLGAKVHVVEFMDRLLAVLDEDASKEIEEEAKAAGIQIHTGSKVKEIKKTLENQAVVIYEDKNGEELLVSEKVLVAIGREPNLEGLDYEKAGISLNERGRGLAADDHMRTNKPHIYAIGDVTNIMQLAHVASHQGITAVKNILGEDAVMDYSAVPNVVFTAPEIASAGLTEEECKKRGLDYKTGRFDYAGNGKALTLGEPGGFIKLLAEKESGKLLGAVIVGADASSLIAAVTVAMKNGVTAEEISETIFAHPTTAEVIHEAALELGTGALHQ